MPYTLDAVRALALHAQGLTIPLGAEPAPTCEAIYDVVRQLGCVQIDTIHVVRRSHYLVLWSRLGCYDPADFERLIYGDPRAPSGEDPRRLFEGWLHAASIIPFDEYRYRLPHMRKVRENPAKMSRKWLAEPGTADLLQHVRDRIRREGPLGAADFPYDGPKRGGWWDWKPTKNALAHLFAWGDLLVADRVGNFQIAYDLCERVLPHWVDRTEPTWDEMARHRLEQAVRSFGVCRPNRAADYASEIKRTAAQPLVEQLLAGGILQEVQARLCDGEIHKLIVHRENLPFLEQAADGALAAERTTFLSPFDSLFWPEGRDEKLWGFHKTLEAYKPKAQRKWGYYCLPILHKDRLVGRFDPKLEREAGVLYLRSLYLEPGIEPAPDLVVDVAAVMRDFLAFHGAHDLGIEKSEPAAFGEKLLAAM